MATSTVGKSRNHKKMEEYHHGNRENKKEYYEKNKDKKSNIDGITVKVFETKKKKNKAGQNHYWSIFEEQKEKKWWNEQKYNKKIKKTRENLYISNKIYIEK